VPSFATTQTIEFCWLAAVPARETNRVRGIRAPVASSALEIETIGVRNVLRSNPATHWIAVLFAVRVDPATVTIGEPHKFDRLNWFAPDALPKPLHSQTAAGLELFGAWKVQR
jgi:8-oxo-dGTP diphosphatase